MENPIPPAWLSDDWFQPVVLLPLLVLAIALGVLAIRRLSRRDTAEPAGDRSKSRGHRLSEAMYRALFDSANDGILIIEDGRIVDCNSAATRLFGRRRRELLGLRPQDVSPPTQPDGKPTADREAFYIAQAEAGVSQLFEWMHTRPDGSLMETEVSLTGIRVGQRSTLLALVRDIGERKRMETALRTSEQRFRLTFDQSPLGAAIARLDRRFVRVNEELCRLVGYAASELTSMTFLDITHPDDIAASMERAESVASGEASSAEMTKRYVRKDGDVVWARTSLSVIRDDTGHPQLLLALIRDITEQRRAEEDLRESEERYRTLVERLPDGIYRSTHEGQFLQVNPAMAEILGYDNPEELMKVDIKSDLYPDPADRNYYIPILEETGKAIGQLRCKDGSLIWVEDHGTFTYDEVGNVLLHEGIMRDVTERLETEAALDQLLELERLVAELSSDFVDLRPQEIGRQIEKALERIGIAFDLDRVGLWKIDQDRAEAHMVSMWAREGEEISSSLALDDVPEALSTVVKRKVFRFTSLENDAEVMPGEAEFFRKIGSKSHLSVPLLVREVLYGSLSLGTTRRERDWSADFVRAMRVIGEILASAVARARAEEQIEASHGRLRALASELSRVEERERHRIATYLHDQIGQALAVMRLKLGSLAKSLGAPEAERSVAEVRDLLETTINDTQTATFDLSPPILYELGLEAAIEWIGEKMGREHDFRFRLQTNGPAAPVSGDRAALLFRAVRELLMNVVKHAQAELVTAKIATHGAMVHVTVEDDGAGFDTAVIDRSQEPARFGLFSIRERMDFLGGRLEIDSRPGHGTRASLIAPLAVRNESAKEPR